VTIREELESLERITWQRKLDDARRETADARDRAKMAEEATARMQRELGLLTALSQSAPAQWLTKPTKSGKHHGTPWLILSDLHLDEVVNPAELMGVNAYDRRIAELRLKRCFESAVKVTGDYWQNISYDGIVVALAGDIFSGDIHQELSETNEAPILDSLLHWADHLSAGLNLLADTFGKVHVPVVVGNHGRRTRKPRAKMRARDNFDWFIGQMLARQFRNDKRITFDVSEAADTLVQSYGHRVCITHGDQARGGGGIAGIWSPITRLDARKRQRQAAVNQPYDLLVMGHWHNLIFGPSFIVNGSLKGYDEYAATENFNFEPPAQALWLMTPEHGKTWTAPLFVADRKAEKW
jgi:hypothetical protein